MQSQQCSLRKTKKKFAAQKKYSAVIIPLHVVLLTWKYRAFENNFARIKLQNVSWTKNADSVPEHIYCSKLYIRILQYLFLIKP